MPQWWLDGSWFAWTIYALLMLWFVIAMWRYYASSHSLNARSRNSGLVRIRRAMFSSWQLHTEEWVPAESYASEEFDSFELSQEVFESQQSLLKGELQALTPSVGDERLVYGLVYAPYDEDVFLRESAMVKQVLEESFDARGRVVRLVNNSTTATELPWATTLNLERSLRALAEAMDTERDVLVIYLTSHGGDDFKLAADELAIGSRRPDGGSVAGDAG